MELIDLRTIRPLDVDTILESVKKTNRLVILEESWPFGNISTEITYQVQNQIFDFLDAPIEKLTLLIHLLHTRQYFWLNGYQIVKM